MHPHSPLHVRAPARLNHPLHISVLYLVHIDQLAALIVPFLAQLLYKGLAQAPLGPVPHARRLGDVDARCSVPPESFLLALLEKAALRDMERVCMAGRDVGGHEGGICGRVAEFEEGRLEAGEPVEDFHGAMNHGVVLRRAKGA